MSESSDCSESSYTCSLASMNDSMDASADSLAVSVDTFDFSTTSHMKKRLRFGSVEIMDILIILGDNVPSDGAPISIGWKVESTRYTNVDVLELCKGDYRRRDVNSLRLTADERDMILLRAGYSPEEIQAARDDAAESRKQREVSFKQQKWEFLENKLQKMKKLIKRRSEPIGGSCRAA